MNNDRMEGYLQHWNTCHREKEVPMSSVFRFMFLDAFSALSTVDETVGRFYRVLCSLDGDEAQDPQCQKWAYFPEDKYDLWYNRILQASRIA